MSNLQVDNIFNKEGTTSSNAGVKPPLNDDTTLIPSTAWVQDEFDSLLTQDRTVSGDWTFSGDLTLSGVVNLSGTPTLTSPIITGTPTFPGLPIFPVSMGVYTTIGKANGPISMAYEAGNTHTPTKTEPGSVTFNLTSPMTNANHYVVLANAYGTTESVTVNCEVTIHSASSFTIVTEVDSGTNVEAEVRFLVFGAKA